jgi:putative SOS response-associated peptidase YedK
MCGRYSLFGPATASRDAKEWMDRYGFDIISQINQRDDQFNIAPTQKALIVGQGPDGADARMYRWGLIPTWAKDTKIGAKMINARAETVAEKPAFRSAFKKRRCLVPASGYFEWSWSSVRSPSRICSWPAYGATSRRPTTSPPSIASRRSPATRRPRFWPQATIGA